MKIACVGYGKMAKEIEEAAVIQGHTVVARCTTSHWDAPGIKEADVCFEFTHPGALAENIRRIAPLCPCIVVGTSGWDAIKEEMLSLIETTGIGLLYSPNFAIGGQLFLRLVAYAARLFRPFKEYEAAIEEAHHRHKRDAPSATALLLAKKFQEEQGCVPPIASLRCGAIPGTHTVLLDSPAETLSFTHAARNRKSMAEGALAAAVWLQGRTGFYTLDSYIEEKIQNATTQDIHGLDHPVP